MQFRKQIILISTVLLFILNVKAQSTWNFELKASVTSSSFSLNKNSNIYSSKWDKIDIAFPSKTGFAISSDIEKHIFDKWSITGSLRYSSWGGQINSSMPAYTLYLFNMNVNYQSIDIPICVRYYFYKKDRKSIYVFGGYGYSNTYNNSYIAKTNFGTGPQINEKMDLETVFLCAGIGAVYKMTNKISGIISFEINNDMLLKNNRTQNYHGINGFSYIPINYNLFALNIGVKI